MRKRLSEDERSYLQRCASLRQTSVAVLADMLIKRIAQDQLVLAILDDDSRPVKGKQFHYRKRGAPEYVPS